MRYVIVMVVSGEAGDFNNSLRKEVFEKFGVKSSKLPAHITLKAPFEYEGDISELEDKMEKFVLENNSANYKIEGFKSFDKRVIYMNVIDNENIRNIHRRFIKEIKTIPFIEFGSHEGDNAIFHVTISSKKLQSKFNEVWQYVNERECNFQEKFNNISIFKWEDNTWKLYKKYLLQN